MTGEVVEAFVRVASAPHSHGEDVMRAVDLVITAGRFAGITEGLTTTGRANERFATVVNWSRVEALETEDELAEVQDIPYYIPDGWSNFLDARTIEDPDLVMPWLTQFDDD